MSRRVRAVGVLSWLILAPGALAGQVADSARHGPIFARSDAAIVGVAAITTTVLIGWDAAIANRAQSTSLQRSAGLRDVLDGAAAFGDPGSIVLGAGLWLSGRLAHDATRERIGLRSLEAVVVSGALTGVIKGVAGRARPYASPGNARDFRLGRGIGDRGEFQSFPSGHSTAAWAFASAVDAEWRRLRPTRPRWVPAALYTVATLTAASRVYNNKHWTSDVVLGSAIGFVTGRAVVRWHADHP